MKYLSTRNAAHSVSGCEAILTGISPDGGLFVPESFPQVSSDDIERMTDMSYAERSAYIMGLYLDEFSQEELLSIAEKRMLALRTRMPAL